MTDSEGGDRTFESGGQHRIVDRSGDEEGRNGKGFDRRQR